MQIHDILQQIKAYYYQTVRKDTERQGKVIHCQCNVSSAHIYIMHSNK